MKEDIKAVAICGSPRKDGNTEIFLNHILTKLKKNDIETNLINLNDKRIEHCTACGECKKNLESECIIRDDDFHRIFYQILESDIIITGSPVYFGSATPLLMNLLDRVGYVSRNNGGLLSRKIGGPVAVARRAGQNFTFAQMLYWYLINDMIVAGSSYWNIGFGAAAGEILEDAEALNTGERFAENLIWIAEKL